MVKKPLPPLACRSSLTPICARLFWAICPTCRVLCASVALRAQATESTGQYLPRQRAGLYLTSQALIGARTLPLPREVLTCSIAVCSRVRPGNVCRGRASPRPVVLMIYALSVNES